MAFAPTPSRQDALSQMNITPLVDVMLVMLVIFMIATPLMLDRTKVALPQVEQVPDRADRPSALPVTVAITEDGRLFLDDEPVTRASLESRLSVEAQKQPQPVVNLRGDKATPYRFIDEVVDLAQGQGMRRIGFVATLERD
ncbi:MAG: biopolymer transporter ExbD [Xanthomonadales bacterium]|nr:biopolymer transporter ExbD [Xanthomonadales bacterium]